MSVEALIATYGYPVLLPGAIFEGETILMAGGFLAHRGYLELNWVLLTALLGTLAVDQFFFYLGRSRGASFVQRRPSWQLNADKARRLLDRHETSVVVGFRFLYGLRTIAPFVIGMSGLSLKRFTVLNTIGAVAWVLIVGMAGYAFGQVLESLLSDIKRFELWILPAMVLLGCLARLLRKNRFRHQGVEDRKQHGG